MKRMLNCLKVEKCVFGVWVAAERRQRERERAKDTENETN